jgi:N-acetylmuramic acid 6-phosphate etherase
VQRAVRLTMAASGADESAARQALASCGSSVKGAIVMLRAQVPAAEALHRLDEAGGSVHRALKDCAS